MPRTRRVVLIARLVFGVALFIGALGVPAYAGTILAGTYTATLTGVSQTTVQASFALNTTTDVFSGTLDFTGNSIFNGVTETFSQAGACISGVCGFALDVNVSGDTLVYGIGLNENSGSYSAAGSISKANVDGLWADTGKVVVSTPEGGSVALYLVLDISALLALGWLQRSRRGSRLASVASERAAA